MAIMAKNVIEENGEMLIDSIKNGPFQLKEDITIPASKGVPNYKRPQRLEDLTPEEKYAKLINDMNIIGMTMTPIQVNTKFVNHLQPEWSRVVTAAKQAKDLHRVNFDHLCAFLKHNEKDANEVRAIGQRYPYPLAFLLTPTTHLHLTAVRDHSIILNHL
ncbi:hypothetical protein Tco_0888889, partial [Tanacetum coccineum]